MRARSWKYRTVVTAGFALSALFLWLAFRQVNADKLATAFLTVKPAYVLLCSGILSLGVLLRALRWRVIAGQARAQQRVFIRATNLGVLGNLIFPGRAGEFVRVVTLARGLRSPFAVPLASAFFDRLVDVFMLLASAGVLYCLLPVSEALSKLLTSLFILGCLIAAALILYARSARFGEILISRIATRWLQRWPLDSNAFFAELRSEFHRLVNSWLSLELVLLALLVLFADYATVTAVLWSFDLFLPPQAPLLLWVFLAAGSALPSAPGYVGVYQVASVWALSSFSVSASTAVAVATVLQIVALVVALLMAGPSAIGIFKRNLSEAA